MEKKNTVLLTVIAIATLLVAVVGATFAYFGASTTNTASSTVQVETKPADVFNASGGSSVSLTVNASDMQQADGDDEFHVKKEGTASTAITVSLTAGSGKATCEYDVIYTPTAAFNYAERNTSSKREFVVFSTVENTSNVATTKPADAEWDMAGISTAKAMNGSTKYVISAVAGTPATTKFTFKPAFYNFETVDQSSNAGKTFGGSFTITNVVCTNSAVN